MEEHNMKRSLITVIMICLLTFGLLGMSVAAYAAERTEVAGGA